LAPVLAAGQATVDDPRPGHASREA